VYEDEAQLVRVEKALAPYPNVILLMPSPDPDESAEVLKARLTLIMKAKGEELNQELLDINKYFMTHPSNQRLAKMVIYTKAKAPAEVCDEILGKLAAAGSAV
jgi:hypothetical protein